MMEESVQMFEEWGGCGASHMEAIAAPRSDWVQERLVRKAPEGMCGSVDKHNFFWATAQQGAWL